MISITEKMYRENRKENSKYELRSLMEDYLRSKDEIIKEILLERIKKLI